MAPHYRPFDDPTKEIRLLTLLPATDERQALEARLHHTRLEGAEYEALSYVWGDQTINPGSLRIEYVLDTDTGPTSEKFLISIGQNLHAALHRLRLKTEPRILWVDAMCINQRDDFEKSKQVQMMSHFYSGAQQVLAWLGPGTPTTTQVTKIISDRGAEVRAIYDAFSYNRLDTIEGQYSLGWAWVPLALDWRNESLNDANLSSRLNTSHASIYHIFSPKPGTLKDPTAFFGVEVLLRMRPIFQHLVALIQSGPDFALLTVVDDLWTREYWTRAWIIREAFANTTSGRPTRLIVGDSCITLPDLFLVTDLLICLRLVLTDLSTFNKLNAVSLPVFDLMTTQHSKGHSVVTFFRILLSYFGVGISHALLIICQTRVHAAVCQVSEPKDAVFAILGLFSDQDALVDYSKSLAQIYTDMTLSELLSGELLLLEYAFSRSANAPQDMPSWAADWAAVCPMLPLPRSQWIQKLPVDVSVPTAAPNGRSTAPARLHIKGITVSRVRCIVHSVIQDQRDLDSTLPAQPDVLEISQQKRLRQHLQRLIESVQIARPGTSQKLARILIGNAGAAFRLNGSYILDDNREMHINRALADLSSSRRLKNWFRAQLPTERSNALYRSLALEVVAQMLHHDLVVFENGLCAFNSSPELKILPGDSLALFYGSPRSFIVRDTDEVGDAILVGPIAMSGIDEEECINDPTLQKTFTLI